MAEGTVAEAGALIVILFLIVGYLLGSIPFGLVITRAAGLGDVRGIGSGNIGATNVLRTGRKGLAGLTFLLDALKGSVAVWIALRWGLTPAMAAGFPRPPLSRMARIQGWQGSLDLYRRIAGAGLARADRIRHRLAGRRLADPVFLAGRNGRDAGHTDLSLPLRSERGCRAVRRHDNPRLLEAPREYRAAAGRHRKQDRREVAWPTPRRAQAGAFPSASVSPGSA